MNSLDHIHIDDAVFHETFGPPLLRNGLDFWAVVFQVGHGLGVAEKRRSQHAILSKIAVDDGEIDCLLNRLSGIQRASVGRDLRCHAGILIKFGGKSRNKLMSGRESQTVAAYSTVLHHHKLDLAILCVTGSDGVASEPLDHRPIGEQILLCLFLGRELRFQNAIVTFGAVRDLKRHAMRVWVFSRPFRHGNRHGSSLSEFMVGPSCSNGAVYSARLRPYYDACGVAA